MENITWSNYLSDLGYQVEKTWKNREGYYAELKTPAKSPKGVTNIAKGGKIVRLSLKDVDNERIVGNKKIIFEEKLKMTQKQEKYLIEKFIRPMVKKMLKENYYFLLKGPNDFYKLKSFFTAATPKDFNDSLIQDATFMKICQTLVSHLENMK